MTCRYPWIQLDNNIEVFGDANFAGCISTIQSTVGGVAMWSGQFVKAWSKTMGVLALSSGDSELAAVGRAATEGLGLQSILGDFDMYGHEAIKSDATAAIGMVHRLGLGTVRHLAVGDLWIQHHVRSGRIRVSEMSGLENPSDAQTKYLGQEPLQRHTKACNWVPVDGEEKIDHKSRTRRPILLMVTRCKWEPNGLQPWGRGGGTLSALVTSRSLPARPQDLCS